LDLIALITEYSYAFSFFGFLFALIALLLVIINIVKTSKIMRKHKRLMRGVENKSFEALLEQNLSSIKFAVSKVEDVSANQLELKAQVNKCIQGVGVVRYNPFQEMGSDLSFSVALINSQCDGVVITGIFGRQSSSTYAKMILSGKSTQNLLDEEQQALRQAMDSLPKRD